MRLLTFEDPVHSPRIGSLTPDGRIVDLHAACALYLRDVEHESAFYRLAEALVPPYMSALFQGGDTSLEAAQKAFEYVLHNDGSPGPRGEAIFYSPAEITLKAPIIPRKFFQTSHDAAPATSWSVFFQNVDAIIGHDEPVIYPEHLTEELDSDPQLAIVLKKGGKHLSPEEAADHVSGYVIFNSMVARDIQHCEAKEGISNFFKSIDFFCPLGPWIVTADEIRDPYNLSIELRINGESRQRLQSSKMSVKIPEILSRCSAMGYNAGDVISAGDFSAIAAPDHETKARYLKPGDVIECEIESIGVLRNQIISWEEAYGRKPAIVAKQAPE